MFYITSSGLEKGKRMMTVDARLQLDAKLLATYGSFWRKVLYIVFVLFGCVPWIHRFIMEHV